MAAVPGRSSAETRNVTVSTTNASTAITGAAGTFMRGDVGAPITSASGIAAATTIAAVASDTATTLSANATATGSRTATISPGTAGVYGFRGWSPESDVERDSLKVVAVGSDPSRLTASNVPRQDHLRSR